MVSCLHVGVAGGKAKQGNGRISTSAEKHRPHELASDQLIPPVHSPGKRDLEARSHYSFCVKPTCEHSKRNSPWDLLGLGGGWVAVCSGVDSP